MSRSTTWPLMSSPRIASAFSRASSGVRASFTPPALPRPPVFTCALTTSREAPAPSRRSAASRACPGVVASSKSSTGTPCFLNSSRAWYS